MPRTAPPALSLAALAAALFAGCQSVDHTVDDLTRIDPGVTGYAHVLGWSSQRYVYALPMVERAVAEAMTDMEMHSVRRKVKGKDEEVERVVFEGLLYDGRCILVQMEPNGPRETNVRMRIDVYGDEPVQRILLQRISIRLATLPQSVNPPYDPRTLSDSVLHRGMDIEGYRGTPLR